MSRNYSGLDSRKHNNDRRKCDLNISDTIAEFDQLRISALTKAAEISPYVNEVTIGPNSVCKEKSKITMTTTYDKTESNSDLLEDKIGEDLRYTIILKKYEKKIKQTSEDTFKSLLENMIKQRSEVFKSLSKKQSEEWACKDLELQARKIQIIKHLRENDNLSVLDKAKLDEQKCQIINKQTIENMNRILEEQNKATARFASITHSHTRICICYNEITQLAQTEPLVKDILNKYITTIYTAVTNISNIMDYCSNSTITDKEVKQAEVLSSNIENIKSKILSELHEAKLQVEHELLKKNQEAEEAKKKEQEKQAQEKQAQELKAAEMLKTVSLQQKLQPVSYSERNYSNYIQLKNFLEEYESRYKELLLDPNFKKFRFDCQKAVNTPVNTITSVSAMHMKDKVDKLSMLLRGETVQVLDSHLTVSHHPQGLFFCTALLAKKIVRAGDLLVSSNPDAAFPLASLTVALWSQFPEFGKLLDANFHRECPYLVPMVLPQKEGQTDKEFYLSRGYTYSPEGVVEKQDKFLKRMSGVFRLRCAIWIAKTPRYVNMPNPQGLAHAWQWLCSYINLKPEPDISATLLNDFLTVCGSEFFKYYKIQFIKVIKLISTDYLAKLADIDEGGPKSRLQGFLQDVLNTGQIASLKGLLPSY